jgi:nitronate monooxygenase
MTLRTAFTELTGVQHPVVSAPMSGSAGGALAAAVSNAGGLGLVGGGRCERSWVDRECRLVAELTSLPWGVGFVTWATSPATIDAALTHQPAAVMLSFGDPGAFATQVRAAGALLIAQVSDLAEARRAVEVGADLLVAQGTEGGGHGGSHGTLPLVPTVIDAAPGVPVLAAGGIADGRGLAAVLALGAAGALVGTLFQASHEALRSAAEGAALVNADGQDTERSRTFDIASGSGWPARYPGRALRNGFRDQWRGRDEELAADESAQRAYRQAVARGDRDVTPVWAGEAVGLIRDLSPAGDLVHALVSGAEQALARAAQAVR